MIVPAFIHLPKIAMPARHRDNFSRVEKAGRTHQIVFDGPPQAVVPAADVSDACEPAVQGMAEHASCVSRSIGLARAIDLLNADIGGIGMDMHVDHAGHHGASAHVDELGSSALIGRSISPGSCRFRPTLACRRGIPHPCR